MKLLEKNQFSPKGSILRPYTTDSNSVLNTHQELMRQEYTGFNALRKRFERILNTLLTHY